MAVFLTADHFNPVITTVFVLLRTFLQTGLFILAHDAMHGSLTPGQPSLNRRIGNYCLLAYAGLHFESCRLNHMQHHLQPESSDDPDYCEPDKDAILEWYAHFLSHYLEPKQFLKLTLLWFSLYLLMVNHHQQAMASLILFCVIPLILSSWQLFIVGIWLPHRPGDDTTDKHGARSLNLHPALSLAACYHFGYHFEHHQSPHTPWHQLAELRASNSVQSSSTQH
ncbi:beta-carotene ketolase [Synechococcus sp. BS56D]|jgi:beta-carotene ketolase (CrtW type)|uniref:fatty acid desaturase n=1 Tax=Synechococcus sp. BS56D TaxID=2055944 RepID=UPI00103D9BBF|nr:fatty acid desaturase [Synechococcus sp. BS56D]TCD59430.1 beta-carotene ketolase [Synechococcus sp. BS56D]